MRKNLSHRLVETAVSRRGRFSLIKYIIIAAILGSLFRAVFPTFTLFTAADNTRFIGGGSIFGGSGIGAVGGNIGGVGTGTGMGRFGLFSGDTVSSLELQRSPIDSTGLIQAAIRGNKDGVRNSLADKIPIDEPDREGRTALIGAAYHGQDEICVQLLAAGANLYHRDQNGFTALDFAASRGLVDTVKTLLETTDIPDSENHIEYAMLMQAAFAADVGLLPKNKGMFLSVNRLSPEDKSPLHIAARNGAVDMVSALIEHGAKVNFITTNGQSPLHWAAQQNKTFVISFLLKKFALIDMVDNDGNSALMLATENANSQAVELLVKKGADKTIRNKNGDTAASIAKKRGFKKIHAILKNHANSTR